MDIERTKEYYEIEFNKKGRSPKSIADEWGTYPNKIRRELEKYGYKLRNKSEAQSVALASGRHTHPTKGKKRPNDVKVKISEKMAANWAKMSQKEKQKRAKAGKKHWESMSEEDKKNLRELAFEAIRRTTQNGSKLEEFILKNLRERGYEVLFHTDHILPKTRLQTDLFIPSHMTVIEIDGPSHFYPIWGQENLEKNIEADNKKNGYLLAYGFIVIRVKHLAKTTSEIHKRKLLSQVIEVLEGIKDNPPERSKRLIEIEIK